MEEHPPHTLRSFDSQHEELRAHIAKMGEIAEQALRDAMRAFAERDVDMAVRVVQQDHLLDDMETEAERSALELVAMRAPLADDLRDCFAALKISGVIERIGDYAKNIARRVTMIDPGAEIESVSMLLEMSRVAGELVHDALVAFQERNAERAHRVWVTDRVVDEYYNSLFRVFLTYMLENPQNIGEATQLLFIAKHIERIGDHATNIAEMVYFAATGERLADRPRGVSVP
jgi:phosphate transport system protein